MPGSLLPPIPRIHFTVSETELVSLSQAQVRWASGCDLRERDDDSQRLGGGLGSGARLRASIACGGKGRSEQAQQVLHEHSLDAGNETSAWGSCGALAPETASPML
eukprot:1824324-Rhodomonas_salina.1